MKKSSIVGMLALALALIVPTVCRAGNDSEQNEEVAYFGAICVPVTPAMAEKMELDGATGMKVVYVIKGSPADGVIKKNDVLLKMGEQKLVDFKQLTTLIKEANPGDTVEFELVRDAAKTNASVVLGARKKHGPFMSLAPTFVKMMDLMKNKGDGEFEMDNSAFQAMICTMEKSEMPEKFQKMQEVLSSVASTMKNTDGSSISLKIDDGMKTLVVKDKEGNPVFDGPINTEEERAQVPEQYRDVLDNIEATTTNAIKNPGEGKVKIKVSVRKTEEGVQDDEE
jgi:hypothetical protein